MFLTLDFIIRILSSTLLGLKYKSKYLAYFIQSGSIFGLIKNRNRKDNFERN